MAKKVKHSDEDLKIIKEADKEIKKIGRRDLRKVSDIKIGEVIAFKYKNPKTKDKMKKFDASPLCIVVDVFTHKGEKYMYAVNLHWIKPDKKRKEVWEFIIDNYIKLDVETTKNKKVVKKRFIKLVYNQIRDYGFLKNSIMANNAFRMYILKRMTDVRRVPLKFYKKMFTKDWKNAARARWAYQSKGHKIKGYLK